MQQYKSLLGKEMLLANELRTKQITKVLGFPQGNTFIFSLELGSKLQQKYLQLK